MQFSVQHWNTSTIENLELRVTRERIKTNTYTGCLWKWHSQPLILIKRYSTPSTTTTPVLWSAVKKIQHIGQSWRPDAINLISINCQVQLKIGPDRQSKCLGEALKGWTPFCSHFAPGLPTPSTSKEVLNGVKLTTLLKISLIVSQWPPIGMPMVLPCTPVNGLLGKSSWEGPTRRDATVLRWKPWRSNWDVMDCSMATETGCFCERGERGAVSTP